MEALQRALVVYGFSDKVAEDNRYVVRVHDERGMYHHFRHIAALRVIASAELFAGDIYSTNSFLTLVPST